MNRLLGIQKLLDKTRQADFLAPLLLRIFLAPIFIIAGYGKLTALENTAYYFGEILGMPAPMLMAFLAGATEFFGGIALLIGLATRWFALPLMMTMMVAAGTAHWENGWHALPESTLTVPWEWRSDLIEGANERKDAARSLLKQHGNYDWLTETGSITILKNGIEFAATYFIMLLALFFMGGGRYLSLDYWIEKKIMK
ncbi:MAG: DoxX family protein [Gammaproteobacteria bacterium]|nr:DoxX family protein [Gammaproteobacteria bacterium]